MKQVNIILELDTFFEVQAFDEREGWSFTIDSTYQEAAKPFVKNGFWESSWNGLMLDNTDEVDRVYLVVFPSRTVLDTIIAKEVGRGGEGALIFAHHPAAYHEAGKGFSPIPIEQLEELEEHRISFYNCHAPLDCHTSISTGNAMANALGLNDVQRFAKYYGGYAGVIGTVPDVSFSAFAERLADVCELDHLRYDQILHNGQPVKRVAIVPGGGDSETMLDEAQARGADTYVTGHWHLFGDNDFAEQRRESFKQYIPNLKMNLLAASHYSSEMVVMRDQMQTFFDDKFDLEAQLIRQDDPWG